MWLCRLEMHSLDICLFIHPLMREHALILVTDFRFLTCCGFVDCGGDSNNIESAYDFWAIVQPVMTDIASFEQDDWERFQLASQGLMLGMSHPLAADTTPWDIRGGITARVLDCLRDWTDSVLMIGHLQREDPLVFGQGLPCHSVSLFIKF